MDENKVLNEEKRLIDILDRCGVSDRDRDVLAPVIDNLAWMAAKLDETRKEIGFEAVAIPYDNGGGQSGIRENPLYKGYVNLWRAYLAGFEKLAAYLPEEERQEAVKEERSLIDVVKGMKSA